MRSVQVRFQCAPVSECGSASDVWKEHQVRKGLHGFVLLLPPPPPTPPFPKARTPFRTECYRRKLHHSTVQKRRPSSSGGHCGPVHPYAGSFPAHFPMALATAFLFFQLTNFEYIFHFSGVYRWGPYADITVITTLNNIAQSTSKASQ